MRTQKSMWIVSLALVAIPPSICAAAPPRVTDDKYRLEQVAVEPEIVTPIGMAFDRKGRLLVIESHTHQDPPDYKGPERDRLRMLSDSDGDGRLDRWSTFAEGFRHAMNVLLGEDGGVYLVERGRLLLLRDTDDDGAADKEELLLRLESEDDYPHNALGGIDQAADGLLILGLGENHGLPFRIVAADGKVFSATGGLDGFFRCSADGTDLEHFARGVWNPFSLCVVPDGRIFAVDNDPDASPPCRLLHVVDGGDYGYLYQYGRAGTHPLQAWNGELPGTLPMVCGTGEAPTAIVPHAGSLWVTSWGDHRIERYRLIPRGASYSAEREIVVQGDADFRPTGMAVAPDGSIFFGDWVLRDYPVHGRGRIWQLTLSKEDRGRQFPARTEADKTAASYRFGRGGVSTESNDLFFRTQGVFGLSRVDDLEQIGNYVPDIPMSAAFRFSKLQAWRLRGTDQVETLLRAALKDEFPDIRLFAVRWIADERIISLRDEVAKLLDAPPPSQRYYLAVLAAIDWLDNEPEMRGRDIADELLVRELENTERSADTHALALGLLSSDSEFLTVDRLKDYLDSEHRPLRSAAARSLCQRTKADRFELLSMVASDDDEYEDIRAEAVMGLSAAAEEHKELLETLSQSSTRKIALEAERALRLSGLRQFPPEEKPPVDDLTAWLNCLKSPVMPKLGGDFSLALWRRAAAYAISTTGAVAELVPTSRTFLKASREKKSSLRSCGRTRKSRRIISHGSW